MVIITAAVIVCTFCVVKIVYFTSFLSKRLLFRWNR